MENGLISVIVPIYKVEEYLDRCVSSIVNQTYRNLEIILVDDGSPDNCPNLCDEWKEKDDRIIVIHKENGGLSDARNAGLAIAKGEYIFFIDSDDWIHRETIEHLYDVLCENRADIAECDRKNTDKVSLEDEVLTKEEILEFANYQGMEALLYEKPLKQTVWNKLYKKEVIADIAFEKGKYHEDEFFTYRVFANASKIVYSPKQLYYYFQRPESIMGEQFSIKRMDGIKGRYERLLFIEKRYPKLVNEAKKNLIFICLYYGQKALMTKDEALIDEFFKQAGKYVESISIEGMNNLSFKEKIWIKKGVKSLKSCCKLRNTLGIGTR